MTSDWSDPRQSGLQPRSKNHRWTAQRRQVGNIVLHDGGHHDPSANREPSITAAEMLVERYKPICRFVTLDAWI